MLYLTKVLTLLVLPLGWVLLMGAAALILLARGRRGWAGALVAGLLVLLWVCAMPWTAYHLTAGLEGGYPPVALEQTPVAEVAVVLGGAVGPIGEPPTENLTGSSNRVLRAARLFRAGKVHRVLAVGGNLDWMSAGAPEAELIRDLLVEWGLPREAIFTEPTSRNTRENALRAAAIIREQGWEHVLLVTSASHMRRAVEAFQAVGIAVIPSPTDFASREPLALDLLNFLPDAGALLGVSKALREVLGLWVAGMQREISG
ncbi:MAG: YdcF family protein [Chromatiaceae bacterium]